MAYIGPPAPNRFVAPKAASVFSGDGSTTAFTLDHAVGSDEDILVSVDGVIQEPSVAYAVSSGTTLTFTAAPSSNSGNNIFVYYLFRTVGTVSHPSSNALEATSGTFTGDVTIGDASAADKKILFDGNAQDFHIGLDDSNDSLTIGLGSALGTTSHMVIDANGHVTKPLQPAFLATKSSIQSNIAINSVTQITFDGERFDQNGDFSSSTFTAPVTGRYQFNVVTTLAELDQDSSYVEFKLETSNVTYTHPIVDPDGFDRDLPYFTITYAQLVDMDANDVAKASLYIPDGSAQTDVRASQSFFSGYLVC